MRGLKRLIAIILSVCLLAAMMSTAAFAAVIGPGDIADEEDNTTIIASGYCGGSALTWELDSDGKLTISGTGAMDTYLTPAYVPWYDVRGKITKVEIGNGVTSIFDGAFIYCDNLTGIWVDGNNPYYSSDNYGVLFNKNKTMLIRAPSLLKESYAIPGSVTSIDYGAFYGCDKLTSITIPDGVIRIDEKAFYGCSKLTGITIPDSVTHIGYSVFMDCSGLISAKLGNGITNIGNYAFRDCTSLTTVIIPDGVKSIGAYAFFNCENLISVTIPDGVTSIGSSAFYGCKSLTNIIIPDGVTSIGSSTFYGCRSLTNIIIPDGVTSIGDSAFKSCVGLTGVSIPDSVTSIGQEGFYYCTSLTNITIPDSVTRIGNYVFYACDDLTSITLGNSITSIGEYAFSECTSLQSIAIPDSVISIGNRAFSECTSLTSVTIPENVSSIGYYAFERCDDLTGIWVDDNNSYYSSDNNGVLFDKNKTVLIDAPGALSGSYSIPNSVTSIEYYAFEYCTNLICIMIPDSVAVIGNYAFTQCSNLQSVTISDGVASIGDYAFTQCSNLQSITIPDSVTSIGVHSFSNCDSLTSVIIGDGITRISSRAFSSCDNLFSITLGNSVTNINTYAFDACFSLKKIIIPVSVANIANNAFYNCYNLTDVYYAGTESQWPGVYIGSGNTYLEEATIYYNHSSECSFSPVIIAEPTCTEVGYIEYVCTCGNTYYEETAALGHDHSQVISATGADCVTPGLVYAKCIRCEDVKSAVHTEALGHNYIDGVCTRCECNIPFAITDQNGNTIGTFETIADALANAAEGQTLSLQADVVAENVAIASGVSLDLNGHTLTVDSVLTYSSSAVIDTSDNASGLLKITEADGNMISKDNTQLPVYDSEAGGYRFFAIDVKPCAVTGGNKYWFKVKAEKFAPLYDLINADAEVQIKVKMTWDGQTEEAYAAAGLSFTKTWADSYNANEDIYITVSVTEGEGLESFKLIPMITSGGVEISGEEM